MVAFGCSSSERVHVLMIHFSFFQTSLDYTTLGEAHGMISDLLADSNLPPNVASTLKIISTMIALPTSFHISQRPFVSLTPLIERFRDESLEDKVKDQPDLKEDMPLPMVGVRVLLSVVHHKYRYAWISTDSPSLVSL